MSDSQKIPALRPDGKQNPAYYRAWYDANREKLQSQQKDRYRVNIEKRRAKAREAYYKNRERILSQKAEAYANDPEPARAKVRERARSETGKARINAYMRRWSASRCATDPSYRVMSSLRSRVGNALRQYGQGKKYASTVDILGCTIPELVAHLERQFTEGMSWDTYGRRGWHIDHRTPCSAFDLTDPEQQKKCFHYTNLQPMWWIENIRKGGVKRDR